MAGRLMYPPDALPPSGVVPVPFATLNGAQKQAVAAARLADRSCVWGSRARERRPAWGT